MEAEPNITLHCIRKDGERERTQLSPQTLSEAREVAHRILRIWGGFYTEVDICMPDGTIETIENAATPSLLVAETSGGWRDR